MDKNLQSESEDHEQPPSIKKEEPKAEVKKPATDAPAGADGTPIPEPTSAEPAEPTANGLPIPDPSSVDPAEPTINGLPIPDPTSADPTFVPEASPAEPTPTIEATPAEPINDTEAAAASVEESKKSEVDADEFLGVKHCLTLDLIGDNLDDISKTPDGLSYVYTTLNLNKQKLEHLGNALLMFKHLRYISMTNNKLTDISCIAKLPRLVTLDASKNHIKNIDFFGDENDSLQYLTTLNLSNNLIESLPHMNPPRLTHLHLNSNKISDCSKFGPNPSLVFLELRHNEIVDTEGLCKMDNLETLYLSDNKINTLSGLYSLNNLKRLHLRKNDFAILTGAPIFSNLEYLNLRETKIEDVKEIHRLEMYCRVADINLLGTPLEESLADGLKKEVLIILPGSKLTRFNKEEVLPEDYTEAVELAAERAKEAEEKRLADIEAAAEAAEAAKAENAEE